MSGPADAAIVIVAYKSKATLPRVRDALNAQTLAPAEVLVLENASPEAERVGEAELPHGARLIESETNLGFAGGNNRLARQTGARWLVLLNPDAYPDPDWLEQLMAAAERYPHAALFGSTQRAYGEAGVLDGAGDVMHVAGVPYRGGYGRAMDSPPDGEIFAPCAAAMMIRREVFERLGGFDEDYFCYVEDVDLGYRARLAGETAIQVSAARVDHEGYASSGRRSEFATYHGTRNRLWTVLKTTPAALLPVVAPLHAGVTLLLWLSSARFGQFALFGKALRDGFAAWPRLMEKRRAVQAARTVSAWRIARAMAWNPFRLLTRAPHVRAIRPPR